MLNALDIALIVIALVTAAVACLALTKLVSMKRTLDRLAQTAGDDLHDRTNTEAALGALQHTFDDVTRTLATAQALERHRFESLVQRLGENTDRADDLRREMMQRLDNTSNMLDQRMNSVNEQMQMQLAAIRTSLATQMTDLRSDTNAQLDRMRETVDEKLQHTLNERITRSFALVNESLDKVGRGLGEMQSLAADVGGLKRVLAGVKTRGMLGEVQLGAILHEILSPTQYETDVATVPGSSNRVEFAVKLPGTQGETVYLPIDAKFPGDAYEHLRDALDAGDTAAADAAWKTLETRIKQEARDIHEKYVAPPATTSYGILFLPFEGLYAEVVDRPGLLVELQRSYRVNVAGPSTMAALLNSLQMGFQTVAIQQRASEIQTVLAAVKTEFGTYQAMLRRAQKQLGTVSRTMDTLVGTRTRAMERTLDSITELESLEEAERRLGIDLPEDASAETNASEEVQANAEDNPAAHDGMASEAQAASITNEED